MSHLSGRGLMSLVVCAALGIFTLAGGQASEPKANDARPADPGAKPAESIQPPTPGARVPGAQSTVVAIYRQHCLECHDRDGTGATGRDVFPKVPDFSDAKWHASRTDADFSRAILHGKGKSMPRMKDKLGSVDVTLVVRLVRGFRDGKQVVEADEEDAAEAAGPADSTPVASTLVTRPAIVESTPAAKPDPRRGEAGQLFKRLCIMCHGAEGRGERVRESMAAIPDFTQPDWQIRRRDSQLAVSILDGKGTEMPAFRGKLTSAQSRELVALVRALGPAGAAARPAGTDDDFQAQFRALQQKVEDLGRQVRALSQQQ